jgi:radical SAM superfamily enzyme YgiQ (UPF0313 family)
VHIGIESSSPRVLEVIRKHYTIEEIEKSLDIFRQVGLKVYRHFMMFNIWEDEKGNLQYETPDEVYQTIKYIREKAIKNWIHYISWAFCTPYEGPDLFDIAKGHNIISEDKAAEIFEISVRLPGISPAIMNQCRRKGMLLQMESALRHGNINLSDIKRGGVAKLKYILTPSVFLKRFMQH